MNKHIKGTFIGTTSMGFVKGRQYSLLSRINKIPSLGYCICLYDIDSKAWCPYSNLKAILENWKLEL